MAAQASSSRGCSPEPAADPDWSDLEPEPVTEDAGKVIAIQYTAAHKRALGYLRAALRKGERSQRLLDLTQELIGFNSADYSAWQVRWDVLTGLGLDLQQEYELTKEIALGNAKNYQLWNHRRKLATALGPRCAAEEFAFAAEALALDAKNYHAWAHRQYLTSHWGTWQGEWAYTEQLLGQDVRNNSAWNQRAWLLRADPSVASQPREQLLQRELEYVAEQLAVAPRNDSPWNYLWGLFQLPGCGPWDMGRCREVHIICREALADCPSCTPALDTLAQYYLCLACLALEQRQQLLGAGTDAAAAAAAVQAAGEAALQVLGKLLVVDGIRAAYWQHRKQEVAEVLATCQA